MGDCWYTKLVLAAHCLRLSVFLLKKRNNKEKCEKRRAARPHNITRLEIWKLAVVLPALAGWIWVVYSIEVEPFQAIEGNTLHGNTTQENATQWIAIRYYVMRCTTMQCNTLQCNAMRVWEATFRTNAQRVEVFSLAK